MSLFQDKIAARKARREIEARRLADEAAARHILEEQNKSVVPKQSLTADDIIIPDVNIPSESTEERVGLNTFSTPFFISFKE